MADQIRLFPEPPAEVVLHYFPPQDVHMTVVTHGADLPSGPVAVPEPWHSGQVTLPVPPHVPQVLTRPPLAVPGPRTSPAPSRPADGQSGPALPH